MTRRAVWLSVFALAACGDPAPVVEPIDGGVAAPIEAAPTAAQARALKARLHVGHLDPDAGAFDGGEPPKCRACHAIRGPEPTQPTHRCLGCHEGRPSKVHADVADEQARECLTCHDFLDEEGDPWKCGTCHLKEGNADGKLAEAAPDVPVHGAEACQACHRPHAESPVQVGACLECHETSQVRHDPDKGDPTGCQDCHGGHELAEQAKLRCVSCHDTVPKTARFEGHETCTGCHVPHQTADPVKDCVSCHADYQAVGATRAEAHAQCESCHTPHAARTSPADLCVECHDTQRSDHPTPAGTHVGQCATCHLMHPKPGIQTSPRGCATGGCHVQEPGAPFHKGADCVSCHGTPHEVKQTTEQCARCHAPDGTAPIVRLVKGHAPCTDCHLTAAHAPEAPPKACADCHRPQSTTAPKGHDACQDCHAPHLGTVGKTCADCHEAQASPGQHTLETLGDCADCHRSHGPEGTAEPQACAKCHEGPQPGLHISEGHAKCRDCHVFHEAAPTNTREGCLDECHAEQLDHEPETKTCTGCHPFEKDPPR